MLDKMVRDTSEVEKERRRKIMQRVYIGFGIFVGVVILLVIIFLLIVNKPRGKTMRESSKIDRSIFSDEPIYWRR